MPAVLMVSKPVVPPWNDSSKNLVKDLARAGERYRYHVLTSPAQPLGGPRVVDEPIYAEVGDHTPALRQNLRVLWRLLQRDATSLTHFFFAPNPKTALAARLALLARRRAAIQTVCSTPAASDLPRARLMLFGQRIIVLSRHTFSVLRDAGIDESRLVLIPPGIEIPEQPSEPRRLAARARHGLPADVPLVIYPGDYQFSDAARTIARTLPRLQSAAARRAHFVFACRIKQPASRVIEAEIRQSLAQAGLLDRVHLKNQLPDILELLGACDLCLLPAESLYAKMDLPLVLLEAMALGVPVLVADRPPLSEVLVEPELGVAVPPSDPQALGAALDTLLQAPARLRQMGERARTAAQRHFAIGAVARRHEALYDTLLGARVSQ